jgi:TfoX/Sxy family transcriptional regulator of competence genes
MATWQKSDPALVERFLASLPLTAGVDRRQMFGYPCAFINGNMFAGLHEQRLIVRLPAEAAARPFRVMGKVMKEYAAIDDALDCPPKQFNDWIAAALAYTKSLPPRKPKGKAKPKAKAKANKDKAPARS